ncbi:DNA cytosine methyltransferase [uncultured Methylobacterium sp.]|uniref:DNA cytosine methyltransferase n=1 Tax=uncultured Methylobacterium sp. TaxID=157278 RepID=UPI00260E6DFC|nr:DNA cytosine methyltransferase [uncultured Methylobacterium sp.]
MDLFAGAGGLTAGAQSAGVQVLAAVEKDKDAAATYRANFPQVRLFEADIESLSPPHLCKSGRDLILFGGPPCQGFSTSNRRMRGSANQKNWLFREYIRYVRAYEPRFALIENVSGILEGINKQIFREMTEALISIGYHIHWQKVNAVDFNVPQKRTRVFVVASKVPLRLYDPPCRGAAISVREAIHDLPHLLNGNTINYIPYKSSPKSAYAEKMRNGSKISSNNLVTHNAKHIVERFEKVPPGGNWKNIPLNLMDNYKNTDKCHTGIYKRLVFDEPSIVIGNYRKNMLIHPIEHRGLSVREAARLQSFPDTFEFIGTIGKQQQQVGNAVPPLVATGIIKQIMDQS